MNTPANNNAQLECPVSQLNITEENKNNNKKKKEHIFKYLAFS